METVPFTVDWSAILSVMAGMFTGGWFMRLMVTRHLNKWDSASEDIHQIKTDIAVIKEKVQAADKLEKKVDDNHKTAMQKLGETHDRVIKLEGIVDNIQKSGCSYNKQ